jgi:uncharacterized glyoxalase superfamily protein PhnB
MSIYPALRYRDAHAAIAWLQEALGFEAVSVHTQPTSSAGTGEAEGPVGHAELAFGDGMVMLGSAGIGDPQFDRGVGLSSIYLATPDVDAVWQRAKAAGATVVRELEDMDYGSREFTVTDPEGNSWSVGTYVPQRG